jgi:S1-C subfamily serine protease
VPIAPEVRTRYELARNSGVEIMLLEEEAPAQNGGLWIEDIMISLAQQPVSTVDDLQRILAQVPVGIPIPVIVLRDGRRLERTVVPTEYPAPVGE